MVTCVVESVRARHKTGEWIFRKKSLTQPAEMAHDKADIESLKGREAFPKLELAHAHEEPRLILGFPEQLVAGLAYCVGKIHILALCSNSP